MSEAFGSSHLFQDVKPGDTLNNYTSNRASTVLASMVFSLRRVQSLFDDDSGYESLLPPSVKILDSFPLFSFLSLLCFFIPFPFSFLHLFGLFFFSSSRIKYYPPPFDRKGLLFENGKTFPFFLQHLRDQLIQALVEFNSTRFFLIVRPHCEATKPLTFLGYYTYAKR